MKFLYAIAFATGVPAMVAAQAFVADEQVAALLAQEQAPAGVVFEINEGREDALKEALPIVQGYIKRLRMKWPGIDLAIVSHGLEELGLTKQSAKTLPEVHSIVRQLHSQDKVPVHICEVAAGMNDVGAEDFPDYVNVTAYGPAQLQDYENLGYIKIRVDIP